MYAARVLPEITPAPFEGGWHLVSQRALAPGGLARRDRSPCPSGDPPRPQVYSATYRACAAVDPRAARDRELLQVRQL